MPPHAFSTALRKGEDKQIHQHGTKACSPELPDVGDVHISVLVLSELHISTRKTMALHMLHMLAAEFDEPCLSSISHFVLGPRTLWHIIAAC